MTCRHSIVFNISSLTTFNTPQLVTFSPRRIVVTFHAWAGVFGAWRTSCLHQGTTTAPLDRPKYISYLNATDRTAQAQKTMRTRTPSCRLKTGFFPFSNLFLVACKYWVGGYNDRCCGAHTRCHSLLLLSLAGVFWNLSFSSLYALGHSFLFRGGMYSQ